MRTLSAAILGGLITTGVQAAVFSPNFGSLVVGSDVHNQDGWVVNDVTDQFTIVGYDLPTAKKTISIGDASVVDFLPVENRVTVSHDIATRIGDTTLRLDFLIYDSYDPANLNRDDPAFLNRDNFGFSFGDESSTQFSVMFSPVDPTPSDPDGELNAEWRVSVQYGGTTRDLVNMRVFEFAWYRLDLAFSPNSGDSSLTDFTLSITGANTLTYTDNDGISLDPNGGFTNFGGFWEKVDGNEWGSNMLHFKQMEIVPEPSAALLGLAGLGLLLRRKRA